MTIHRQASIVSDREGSLNPPLQRSFLGGSTACVVETLVLGQILDRIKVEQEASPELRVRQAIHSILQKGGKREMYRGLKWNLSLGGLKGAFGWSLHNICNQIASSLYPQQNPALPTFAFTEMVACMTGVTETTLILCPLERCKIFQMTHTNAKTLNLWQEVRKGGIRFIYRGWSWMMIQKSWSWTGYLTSYQEIRKKILNDNQSQPLSNGQKAFLGASTGCIAACLNAPADLLKTQIQKSDALHNAKVLDIASFLFQKHGWQGMFNGLKMKLLRTAWSTTVTTLVLDYFDALPENMKI